jgi:hypothetical protein
MMRQLIIFWIWFCGVHTVLAQSAVGFITINGHNIPFGIEQNGDTTLLITLREIVVYDSRTFANQEDYSKYMRYKRYAQKVYPYAKQAITIFREVEEASTNMRERERKKFVKEKQDELELQFEDQLKKLTKTQGIILVKMIEKELDTPMYGVIKDLRGGVTASYWNVMSKFFGHKLKNGYRRGEDVILDAVFDDLEITYN